MKHRYHRNGFITFLGCLVVFLASHSPTDASTVVFTGADPGAGPNVAHPNSDAAAGLFQAAAGTTTLIDFESATLGSFTSLNLGSGVTATFTGEDTSISGVSNDNSSADLGFNTTPGGSQFIRIAPDVHGTEATLTFSFASGIASFGAYLTGTESGFPGALTLTFNDGSAQILSIAKNSTPGTQFFGFVTSSASIMSVTFVEAGNFSMTRDIWGIDDIRFSTTAAIPEPNSLALLGLGAMSLMVVARRRRLTGVAL